MKDLDLTVGERVSDLVDGRLSESECALALQDLLSDPQARKTWYAYHVVGDVLRSAELAPSPHDHAFLERLEQRLANEPQAPSAVAGGAVAVKVSVAPSANAEVFRWKLLAGVACTAMLGVVGLSLWTNTGLRGDAQLAAQTRVVPPVPTIVAADTGAGTMLRDARLDELMAAHRQLGGHSALQVPAGFLRNATYEGNAR